MPYPNEHACRLKDPGTLNIKGAEDRKHDGKTYRVIYGVPKEGGGGSVEQAYRYPKATWDEAAARAHCKDHDGRFEPAAKTEAETYKKDLLYPGTFPHPNRADSKLTISPQTIKQIAQETRRFLDLGGDVPITISHPKDEAEKVSTVHGWLRDIYVDAETGVLMGNLDLDTEASAWITKNQLKAVSPGIAYQVTTSKGKFPVLIDHVALTNSPHLLGQQPFVPLLAERYHRAGIYLEGGKAGFEVYQIADPGILGEIKEKFLAAIQQLWEAMAVRKDMDDQDGSSSTEQHKREQEASDMKEYEELKAKYDALEAEAKKQKDDLAEVTKERDDLKARVDKIEAEAKTARKEAFEARVKKLVDSGKVTPAQQTTIMAMFERMSDHDTIDIDKETKPVEDVILAPYADQESKLETKLGHKTNTLTLKEKVFDLATLEGRNDFSDYVAERAKKEDKSYTEMREIVLAEAGAGAQDEV